MHPALPDFFLDLFHSFANLEFPTTENPSCFNFIASLKEQPQAKFAAIVHCIENPQYNPKLESVKSLTIHNEDAQKWLDEIKTDKNSSSFKYPLFLFVCDTSTQAIFYHQVSGLYKWANYKGNTFHCFLSIQNLINPLFPEIFIQEIKLLALDKGRYDNPLSDYTKVFPVLFDGYDEVDILLEHIRTGYYFSPQSIIFEKYRTTEELPQKLVDGLLQMFINHFSLYAKSKLDVLEIFIHYNIRTVIPHLIRTIERFFADDIHREFHGYGYQLTWQIYPEYFKPFLEALISFNVKEAWVYPQLRHLLSYNHKELSNQIAKTVLLLDLPEAYSDFENGILQLPHIFFEYEKLSENIINERLHKILPKQNEWAKAGILKFLGTNKNTFQEFIKLSQSEDKTFADIFSTEIRNYLTVEQQEDNLEIIQAYEGALGLTVEASQYIEQQHSKPHHKQVVNLLSEGYYSQDIQKIKKGHYPFIMKGMDDFSTLISIFKDACKQKENIELSTYVKKIIIKTLSFCHPVTVAEYLQNNPEKESTRPLIEYDFSDIYDAVINEIQNPVLKEKEYLADFLDFAQLCNLKIEEEALFKHCDNGLISLYKLDKLNEQLYTKYIISRLEGNLSLSHFLQFFYTFDLTNITSEEYQLLEQQFIKQLQNPHYFYHLPLLKAVQKFNSPIIADMILEVCQYHTWDKAYDTQDANYCYDYLQYHLNILAQSKKPEIKPFFASLLKLEQIKCDYEDNLYKKHIYKALLWYFGEEGEEYLCQLADNAKDYWDNRDMVDILEVGEFYSTYIHG